ncbi:type VII secretion protein EsaA [Sutcliffiella horikoshii]|uniref:Type VII secretion protein EsaA n=1 Tax=Sutcliffiella horikoshii TaxID=79883 RepID=A0A5D4TCF8_9BACI|nr:type VII secretion protein EsaA [Sutcliffiella horikoshii]TYS73440.1 type VII secretion protein EsaA [Sutcliffiella horikoshii]
MTGKTTYIIKMVLVILLILVTPAVFFGSVGENPMEVKRTASRVIAVVNEDTGMEKDDKALEFGKEISSIFEEDSRYEWTVIGRSAAVNGLEDSKYDAVVYIPSNFSTNIMTYESNQPLKANFEYNVQDQLNTIDREKVLREIEKATSKVNSRISTLYWTYVSQDLENVRAHFDTILQKEIDFQNAMLAFYKPTSLNLASEIERQRSMLESLQSTVTTVSQDAPGRESTVQQFEDNLTSFVQFVDQFKEYQDSQQLVLQELQDESMGSIQLLATAQPSRFAQVQEYFSQGGTEINNGLESVNSSMESNNTALNELSELRKSEVDRQTGDMEAFFEQQEQIAMSQKNADLSELETTLENLKDELEKEGEKEPGKPEDPKPVTTSSVSEVKDDDSEEVEVPENRSFENEIKELNAIAKDINDIQTTINGLGELVPEEILTVLNPLGELSSRISQVEESLKGVEEENPLLKIIEQLEAEKQALEEEIVGYLEQISELEEVIESLEGDKESLSNNLQTVINEIEKTEKDILDQIQDEDRLRLLEPVFDKEINNNNTKDLLNYHASLVQYEQTLNRNVNEDVEALLEDIQNILNVSDPEQEGWNSITASLPSTMEQMQALQDNFSVFMEEYRANIEEQQMAIMNDISSLEESANNVMEQVQLFENNEPIPTNGNDGNTVVTRQQTISQELLTLNELVTSVGESQSSIVSYTTELQTNVENVQNDADTLNAKWAENVDATRMYRDDIFNVLGNAYVDGQKNGPVYEHLSNPLQISGDAASGTEDNRIPPVVVLAIILISSLLIGYFSHYFNNAPMLVQGSMFILLNIIVGLIISLYGLNIYPLAEDRAIQWSIFTVLLLTAASAVVLSGFSMGKLVGWIASVGLVIFFISPFLTLTAPNINYEDPMSRVYMSIQYGSSSHFMTAVITLIVILLLLLVLPQLVKLFKSSNDKKNEDEAYEG